MNDRIIYRPYKSYVWFLPFLLGASIFFFMLAGFSLNNNGVTTFISVLIGILLEWVTKACYDASKFVILFDQDGFQIIGKRYKSDSCHSWENIHYACYVKNYRGFCSLLLSSRMLSPKEAKHILRKSVNPLRICIEDVFIIYLDDAQNMSYLRELIDNHVSNVNTY